MLDAVTVVDAHVHVHPGTETGVLLDSAARNLAAVATEIGAEKWHGVLMLAEMRGTDWFGSTRQRAPQAPGWSIEPVAGDPASLSATRPGVELTIIAGRQIVSAEGIEVLALATTAGIDDGMSLADTISAAVGHGALAVLPWGAGKWLGLRGRLVGEAVAAGTQPVFVGDNGGRPSFWPEPAVFGGAHAKGRPVLSGTDPLPLPGEERRVGSFGFWLPDSLPGEAPSRSLRERLLGASADSVFRFGHLQGAVQFLKSQVQLRMRKGNAVRG